MGRAVSTRASLRNIVCQALTIFSFTASSGMQHSQSLLGHMERQLPAEAGWSASCQFKLNFQSCLDTSKIFQRQDWNILEPFGPSTFVRTGPLPCWVALRMYPSARHGLKWWQEHTWPGSEVFSQQLGGVFVSYSLQRSTCTRNFWSVLACLFSIRTLAEKEQICFQNFTWFPIWECTLHGKHGAEALLHLGRISDSSRLNWLADSELYWYILVQRHILYTVITVDVQQFFLFACHVTFRYNLCRYFRIPGRSGGTCSSSCTAWQCAQGCSL